MTPSLLARSAAPFAIVAGGLVVVTRLVMLTVPLDVESLMVYVLGCTGDLVDPHAHRTQRKRGKKRVDGRLNVLLHGPVDFSGVELGAGAWRDPVFDGE